MDNKYYGWEGDIDISIKGTEFNILYNAINAFMMSPISPRSIQAVGEVEMINKNILNRMIESGQAVEKSAEDLLPPVPST